MATLSWIDVDEADQFGGDVGRATFAFTNVIAPAPTPTPAPPAPAAAAVTAAPAFTG